MQDCSQGDWVHPTTTRNHRTCASLHSSANPSLLLLRPTRHESESTHVRRFVSKQKHTGRNHAIFTKKPHAGPPGYRTIQQVATKTSESGSVRRQDSCSIFRWDVRALSPCNAKNKKKRAIKKKKLPPRDIAANRNGKDPAAAESVTHRTAIPLPLPHTVHHHHNHHTTRRSIDSTTSPLHEDLRFRDEVLDGRQHGVIRRLPAPVHRYHWLLQGGKPRPESLALAPIRLVAEAA